MSYDQKYWGLLKERGKAEDDLMAASARLAEIENELETIRLCILNRDARPAHSMRVFPKPAG